MDGDTELPPAPTAEVPLAPDVAPDAAPDAAPQAEPQEEESFTALVADLATEVGTLVRQELALAAAEMTQKAQDAWRGAVLVFVGVLLATVGLIVAANGLVLALGAVMPMWLAAALFAAIIGGGAFYAYRTGTATLRSLSLVPTETFQSLRIDKELAKTQLAATREQVTETIGEVRKRLVLPPAPAEIAPPPKPKKKRAPTKRKPKATT